MSFFREIFGPSQEEVWSQFADEIEGHFINKGFWKGKKVEVRYNNWDIVFDTFSRSSGKSSTTYTRVRCLFKNIDGFEFEIYKKSIFSGIGKVFGMQDIEIGHEDFDEKYIIKSNDETKIRELLSNDKIREIINSFVKADSIENIKFEINNHEGLFGQDLPDDVSSLYFETIGVVKDLERLRSIYMLFALVLNKLVLMDSADNGNPGVTLE